MNALDLDGFDYAVPLPPQLTIEHIAAAIDYVEDESAELMDIYLEQANVFSAVVGIFGTKALDAFSTYKKHKHPDIAQQRFPDLSLGGRLDPSPAHALESKGTKRPWELQSHYDHPGWYIVWRYLVDPTKRYKPGKLVAVWRVDVKFLTKDDWKYEGSTAGVLGGGRTHTFGVKCPRSTFKGSSVYQCPRVVVKHGVPTLRSAQETAG